MNIQFKIGSFNCVYGVNGGRLSYNFQINFLDKQRQALVGDIITIVNRLRLESYSEKVNVIDGNIKKINKLKQCVDLVFKSETEEDDDDDGYSNLYGLFDTGSDYCDF